jgi:nucleotide-binding universal stress UspA family protein
MPDRTESSESLHILTVCESVPGFLGELEQEAIIEAAMDGKCDLIVMGSRGLGRLAGLLLGSHSQKAATHAPCPVPIAC